MSHQVAKWTKNTLRICNGIFMRCNLIAFIHCAQCTVQLRYFIIIVVIIIIGITQQFIMSYGFCWFHRADCSFVCRVSLWVGEYGHFLWQKLHQLTAFPTKLTCREIDFWSLIWTGWPYIFSQCFNKTDNSLIE